MENKDPKVGDRVSATMNGEDWFSGVFEVESDVLAKYVVRRDDTGELRYFTSAEVYTHKKRTENGLFVNMGIADDPILPQVIGLSKSAYYAGYTDREQELRDMPNKEVSEGEHD